MSQAIIDQAFVIVRLRKWGVAWKQIAESAKTESARLRQTVDALSQKLNNSEAESRAYFQELEEARRNACLPGESLNNAIIRTDRALDTAREQRDQLRVERDQLRAEVAALKHEVDTLSCPYVSGQRVRVKSEGGLITQQSEYGIGKIGIINAFAFVARIGSRGWVDVQDIEPCDLPVDHDTPAGKEAAEAASKIRPADSACNCHNNPPQSGEGRMCVGDEVEVIGRSAPTSGSGMFTGTIAPVGTRGIATMIHGTAGFVELDNGTRASICDVRKVPQ